MVTSAEACLLLPLLLLSFFSSSSSKQSSTLLASAPDSRVRVSNQNFTDGFLLKFYFYFWPLLETHSRLPHLDSYVCLGTVAET
jgi:hypothetical protein